MESDVKKKENIKDSRSSDSKINDVYSEPFYVTGGSCVFCGNSKKLVSYKDHNVCQNCLGLISKEKV